MKRIIFCSLIAPGMLMAGNPRGAEEEFRAFVAEHVKVVEPKFRAMNLAAWNASATGEKRDYDAQAATEMEVRRVYANREDFKRLKEWRDSGAIHDSLLQRQLTILTNSYLVNQIDTALMRTIVEKSAAIAEKFNTYRPVVDGKELDDNAIVTTLRTERNVATRKAVWEASKEVGAAVAPMVIELVKLRNEAARSLGFENFYVLSLVAGEQGEKEIVSLFDELKTLTDEPYRALKAEIDAELAGTYGIRPADLRPWHYQDRFFQEAPQVGTVNLDDYYKGQNVEALARTFYAGIGLPVDDILKNSDLYARKGKYQHAFETDIDRSGDIRVMLSITDTHEWMATMLHELGHGVFSKYIARDLPFLLRVETHTFVTEAIAEMMERQAANADWLHAMTGLSPDKMEIVREAGEKNLRLKQLVFCRWTQVMMRFEREMYRNPDRDLNALWWDLVEEYQLIHRPEGRNSADWAAKIHLAQYPAYYHNYQLGELAASQINHTIATHILKTGTLHPSYAGRPEVGKYLTEKVFAPGSALRWDALIRFATGEPLTAKYFAREFVEKKN